MSETRQPEQNGESPPQPKKPRKPRGPRKCDPVVLKWAHLTGDSSAKDGACASCSQALWQIEELPESAPSESSEPQGGPLMMLHAYCKLMHAFIDRKLLSCSGNP